MTTISIQTLLDGMKTQGHIRFIKPFYFDEDTLMLLQFGVTGFEYSKVKIAFIDAYKFKCPGTYQFNADVKVFTQWIHFKSIGLR
ncbi:hypothetical protein L596_025736 [Steinernema carpocapsae]|uniref:Uncharacterized protein n=1 Tax=Steinernema carpocapsae TaxID=34508 RepID=A0A4U5M8M4_STECR|nr:hypothetical protein L596_025736 [Steinernema carpocapsae]